MPRIVIAALAAAAATLAIPADAQNPIDRIRPDAPERAAYGSYPVGVVTRDFTDTGRADVIAAQDATGAKPVSDRTLTTEIWYPAAEGTAPGTTYETVLRDGETPVTLSGRAARDATPAEGSFPLVLISHGYPGNRFLMSHLGENLASKGYVVVSTDHPDSTYDDMGLFASTLVNRPLDQAFLLDALADMEGDIGAMIDAEDIGLVGYSMGGYGALIFGGAGLSEIATTREEPAAYVAPRDLLDQHAAGSESHAALVDPRLKAVIAIGPWGRNRDFWDASGLAGFEKPLLLVAGDQDDVSGYADMRRIFEETSGTDRFLLSFEGANHNAAAPIPAPENAWDVSESLGWAPFEHYADAVWDTTRMNNVLQHFATAWFDLHLKEQEQSARFFDLVENAEDGVWSMNDAGEPTAEHTYWAGFPERTAKSLRMEFRQAE
ncbi:alpha/beta hydrolase family protein [Citreimonas sp.]|uniref:alpha/beta hydrolase family protein n=1 Tax=Citreimonas sp. TaxID=3036715 RepID=UPI0035C8159F